MPMRIPVNTSRPGHHSVGMKMQMGRKAIDAFGVESGDVDARDVKAQEAAEGCTEYERPQEYRQYR